MSVIGIRKPGQGYWVRVLSAVFWAGLVAAGAGFAWSQAQLIELETSSYSFSSPLIDQAVEVGDVVSLVRPSVELNSPDEIFGNAVVSNITRNESGAGEIQITSITDVAGMEENTARYYGADATRLVEGDLANPTGTVILTEHSATPITAFPQEYLMAGAAGGVMLLGGLALLFTHGIYPKTTDFLIATDGEMRKVNWSTRKEIQGSTVVVIVATFLIAAFLYAFDRLFATIFTALDVLQT